MKKLACGGCIEKHWPRYRFPKGTAIGTGVGTVLAIATGVWPVALFGALAGFGIDGLNKVCEICGQPEKSLYEVECEDDGEAPATTPADLKRPFQLHDFGPFTAEQRAFDLNRIPGAVQTDVGQTVNSGSPADIGGTGESAGSPTGPTGDGGSGVAGDAGAFGGIGAAS